MPVRNKDYEVKLDLFEGPLDLLLYLVTKNEVAIVDISVSQITAQYLEYLDLMRDLNIDLAADYLHMAATLTWLKARELLPPSETEPVAEDEEGIYNREQLIRQLLEYQKFKQAAGALKNFEAEQTSLFRRGQAEKIEDNDDDGGIDLGSLSMFDLLTAFKKVLERARDEEEHRHVVSLDNVKIDDRIERVLTVLSDRGEVPFEELFDDDRRKIVMVVTFMAILELVKMQEISFRQERSFGAIRVVRQKRSGTGGERNEPLPENMPEDPRQ
ncbi:MAG: segregation/condensation protein A [Chitinispirillaceae bacterium]|nr:segregation/condensation protein A [Chitinispirillaceae bacterium]